MDGQPNDGQTPTRPATKLIQGGVCATKGSEKQSTIETQQRVVLNETRTSANPLSFGPLAAPQQIKSNARRDTFRTAPTRDDPLQLQVHL